MNKYTISRLNNSIVPGLPIPTRILIQDRPALVFRRRPFRQVADDGQRIALLVAGLDDHEDPDANNGDVEQLVDTEDGVVEVAEDGAEHPFDDQPGHKEVQTLERVETDGPVVAELVGGEYDHRSDPADARNVTKDGSGARCNAGKRIDGMRGGARLAGAALGAILVRRGDRVPATAAKRHLFINTLRQPWMFRQGVGAIQFYTVAASGPGLRADTGPPGCDTGRSAESAGRSRR